jgi:hypothetical protein
VRNAPAAWFFDDDEPQTEAAQFLLKIIPAASHRFGPLRMVQLGPRHPPHFSDGVLFYCGTYEKRALSGAIGLSSYSGSRKHGQRVVVSASLEKSPAGSGALKAVAGIEG